MYMKIYYEQVDPALHGIALHNAAYAFLRQVLRTDWSLQDVVIEKTSAGKPYLVGKEIEISISHTKGLVCCAVSKKPVGVDCEYRRTVPIRTMERVCTEKELADILAADDPSARFTVYWTLKESISKQRGTGLKEPFKQYEITFQNGVAVCPGYTLHTSVVNGFFLAAAE